MKKVIERLSRDGLVILTPESGTSARCKGCHERVADLIVQRFMCNHRKTIRRGWRPHTGAAVICPWALSTYLRMRCEIPPGAKVVKVLACKLRDGFVKQTFNCPDRTLRNVSRRVRMCQTCSAPTGPYLGDKWIDRDVSAACAMRQIVMAYSIEGERPAWNLPYRRTNPAISQES